MGNLTSSGLIFSIQRLSAIAQITIECGFNSEGKRVVRPAEVTLMPVVHFFKNSEGLRTHSLFPLFEYARRIRAGDLPEDCSGAEGRKLLKLERQYRRYFLQKGIKYI
ncbi:hypothetical protein QA601_13185 [Chitinispirillales bacterium ANBcel5]|uniref:hypothetical protein n=1 Tax=Cellulosispirillum alkaliphilum TaxID=3039283 RepID=UPI002A507BE8|nr:hypothetical protein [Chitinispirillales bacterium ANBcel5]